MVRGKARGFTGRTKKTGMPGTLDGVGPWTPYCCTLRDAAPLYLSPAFHYSHWLIRLTMKTHTFDHWDQRPSTTNRNSRILVIFRFTRLTALRFSNYPARGPRNFIFLGSHALCVSSNNYYFCSWPYFLTIVEDLVVVYLSCHWRS